MIRHIETNMNERITIIQCLEYCHRNMQPGNFDDDSDFLMFKEQIKKLVDKMSNEDYSSGGVYVNGERV